MDAVCVLIVYRFGIDFRFKESEAINAIPTSAFLFRSNFKSSLGSPRKAGL